jgi:methionyl-tRNA formyltransferase
VVAVVTQPDRPAGRGHGLAASPVKEAAAARGLRVITPVALRAFAAEARTYGADAFVVASYGRIVPQALLDIVPIAFNLHPSLLPLYRGATPLQSAIRDGRRETGLTIIAMDAGMDTGDVVLRERTPIGPDETYGELHDRLARRAAEMLVAALEQYGAGTLERIPQDRIAAQDGITAAEIAATATHPLGKDDLRIDWNAPRRRVIDSVRALAPRPLARTDFDALGALKIAAVRAVDARDALGETRPAAPGPFVRDGKRPFFGALCGDGEMVAIERVVAPGRPPASGEDFARSWSARAARQPSAP